MFKQRTIKIRRNFAGMENVKIPIRQAVLSGSYARGHYNEWSNIDIALVSEIFTGGRYQDKKLIRKLTLEIGSEIDSLPFNPNDFSTDNPLQKKNWKQA